jgi:hypothetical protein
MQLEMKNLGPSRKGFTLSAAPPRTFSPKSGRSGSIVPVFQPYDEDLPLQSGFYTFVIDDGGHFRVKWGNTSSHASFVDRGRVAAAGWFRIGRMGKLAEVTLTSYDYRISYKGHDDKVVIYAIRSFVGNQAFDVSSHAIFSFRRQLGDWFHVDTDEKPIDEQERQLLDSEGSEPGGYASFTPHQVACFLKYKPPAPPRLYPSLIDPSVTTLEEDGDLRFSSPSEPAPRLSIDQPSIPSGKINFVLDEAGWLIIGIRHHHILSGGRHVAAAGHLYIDERGQVNVMQLNFSGHYRPPLSAEYVCYTYRALKGHPLVTSSPDCKVNGRKFDEETLHSSMISFDPSELEIDDPSMDERLERLLV